MYNFKEGMNSRPSLILIKELHKALERNQLTVFYQPQVNIRTGKMVGSEALLRWVHPELGMVPPSEFIPIAEETGLIIPIGEWVLKTACAQNKLWQDTGYEPMAVSVNLSPRQLTQRYFADIVRNILKLTGLDPQFLELEITESMTIDINHIIPALTELRELGVSISMDDFGKGYSSLYYLKSLPLHSLKIDASFIHDCTVDDHDGTIVKAIISMAHNLNLNVVAEGVETKEQILFLQQNLCERVQGYFFSRPIPADELEKKFVEIQNLAEQAVYEQRLASEIRSVHSVTK